MMGVNVWASEEAPVFEGNCQVWPEKLQRINAHNGPSLSFAQSVCDVGFLTTNGYSVYYE